MINLSWSDGKWVFSRMDHLGSQKLEVGLQLHNVVQCPLLQVVSLLPGPVEMSQLGFLADYLQSRLWWEGTPAPKRRLAFLQQDNCLLFKWRRRARRCDLRLMFQPGPAGRMSLASIRSSITVTAAPQIWSPSSAV